MPNFFTDEPERQRLFPVCKSKVFLGHAAVTALPACVADAMCAHVRQSCEMPQEFGDVLRDIKNARRLCAEFIGADADEIYRVASKLSVLRESIPVPNDGVYCPVCHIANLNLGKLRTPCPQCGRGLLKFGWD